MLYSHHEKRLANEMEFKAKIAGAKLSDKKPDKIRKEDNRFQFKDPKEYEDLSKLEREKETKKMVNFYKLQNFGIKTNA